MKVLIVHNRYQLQGGEDVVVDAESDLLASRGHSVIRYERHNSEIQRLSTSGRIRLASGTFWSPTARRDLESILIRERPDVAHFHNTFPLISPSAYEPCNAAGVPVVQTVHNYRLICPAATLLREQRVCEECVGRMPWPAVLHGCYRGSRIQSLVAAGALGAHRLRGTYRQRVQRYLALTSFGRDLLVKGGIPQERIGVKPNFVFADPGYRDSLGDYALFVGRLSPEKGIFCLLDAWRSMRHIPLHIVGDGPLRQEVERRAGAQHHVRILGQLAHADVIKQLQGACVLVFPSEWYEGLGNVVLEAMAVGTPVVASAIGAPLEVLEGGRLGSLFRAGDPASLATAVTDVLTSSESARIKARAARSVYEKTYTPDACYRNLVQEYGRALEQLQIEQ